MHAACIAWVILVTSAAQVAAHTETSAPAWTFDASVYTYFVPDDGNYAQPTILEVESAGIEPAEGSRLTKDAVRVMKEHGL